AVLMGGDILDTQAVPVALAERLGNTPSKVGRIYHTVYQRRKAQPGLIIDKFPKLKRSLTGFEHRYVFNDELVSVSYSLLSLSSSCLFSFFFFSLFFFFF
ncbi:hypothetical protein AAER74_27560, partial [Klebsiella pneumoniae]|uniref:hypothetical protein n=1 Tax=Klebsiella pneumoniae TaxID=573 RepID=UPI0031355E50